MPEPVYYKTYADIVEEAKGRQVVKDFCRQKMEAAVAILERIIGQDYEDELLREMERVENREYHRGQNLMMAKRALEEIRLQNGHMMERDFSRLPTERAIYRTHYGMQMLGVQEVLEKFWTGE